MIYQKQAKHYKQQLTIEDWNEATDMLCEQLA